MANELKFLHGNVGALPSANDRESLAWYVTHDEGAIYLDDNKWYSKFALAVEEGAEGTADAGKKFLTLKGMNASTSGSVETLAKIDESTFVKDGMLDSATLVDGTAEGAPEGKTSADTFVKLVWNTEAGKEPMFLDITTLLPTDHVKAVTVNGVDADVTEKVKGGLKATVEIKGSDIEVADEFTAADYNEKFTAAAGNKISASSKVNEAIEFLDNKLAALVDEVIDNEQVVASAINGLAIAAGTIDSDGEIGYVTNTDANYISDAASLADADDKLDAAIKTLDDKVNVNRVVGKEAVKVGVTGTTDATKATEVSLALDAKAATAGSAKIALSQSTNGLHAEVALDNAAATDGAGIGLVQGTDSKIKATLYWGTFGA